MAKIMIFIDGTWLYSNTSKLRKAFGTQDFKLDFGKLPQVLAETVGEQVGRSDIDVVRTFLFGSSAVNCDPRDAEIAEERWEFFDILKEEYHYEVDVFPINFQGRRLRKIDRHPEDTFEPREKCVDIALASTMLYFAALPSAYDIAVAVIGDRDFTPMLQNVRRLGKRIVIVSIKESCAYELSDPRDERRVKDFDPIWLDDLLHKLEFKYEKYLRACESPDHKGNPMVYTTFYPRKGQKFYCTTCLEEMRKRREEIQRQYVNLHEGEFGENGHRQGFDLGESANGYIKAILRENGYGFITATDGNDYYFHFTDLAHTLNFDLMREEMQVEFEIKRLPGYGKAGAAQNVRANSEPAEEDAEE